METVKTFTFFDESVDKNLTVYINELVNPEYGMFTWPCAPVLGQYILKNKDVVIGRTVLEIGAGTALPGILAAKCGANVVLTDAGKFPECQQNAFKCCKSNNVEKNIKLVPLTWGEFTQPLLDLPSIDIIIGSDCFYNPSDFEDILVTVAFLMERNQDCVFWTTCQVRSSKWSLEYLLKKWNLQCREIPLPSFGGNKENLGGHEMAEKFVIQMLEIKRLS